MSTDKPPSIAPKRAPGTTPKRPPSSGRVSLRPDQDAAGATEGPSDTSSGTAADLGAAQDSGLQAPVSLPVAEQSSATGASSSGPTLTERFKKATAAAKESLPKSTSADQRAEPSLSAAAGSGAPRRVRLAVSRIDPWSVMKLSFLLSVAIGIMIVVAVAVIWQTLNAMAVFTQVNDVVATLAGSTTYFDVLEYAAFPRAISLATMIAVIDVILLTALSTLMAFLYNIVAALVGGIHLSLTDD
jgi:hypothetical protein